MGCGVLQNGIGRLLLGVSRKSFVGKITAANDVASRLPGSLACACWGIAAGARDYSHP